MLIWLSGVLLLAAGLTLRWCRARSDALGRPNGFPLISVGLCLVIGLGAVIPVGLHARTEHRLSAAASAIAYRSAGSVPGGPLDEHLPDPPWSQ